MKKMMIRKDQDLGLSLSLSIPSNHHQEQQKKQPPPNLQLNLMPPLVRVPSSGCNNSVNLPPKPSWMSNSFPSSDPTCDPSRADAGSFLWGIDVNRLPSTAIDAEEEAGVSSPNSTISSVSGKRSERETGPGIEDHDNDRSCSRGNSDEEDGENSRKKLRLSKDQSAVLEESFKDHNTLNPKQKMALAKQLGLRPRQVEVWFQNRRARTKLKQTEVDCEFLKRCCENLTEENRRLQKEVLELRALKLSPQLYMQMTPPTTLTMCPSCERVGVPPHSSSAVDHRAHRHNHHQVHHRPMPISHWAPAVPLDVLRPRS